jgi:hypothetical protein
MKLLKPDRVDHIANEIDLFNEYQYSELTGMMIAGIRGAIGKQIRNPE